MENVNKLKLKIETGMFTFIHTYIHVQYIIPSVLYIHTYIPTGTYIHMTYDICIHSSQLLSSCLYCITKDICAKSC
jgi:hypothetical protein